MLSYSAPAPDKSGVDCMPSELVGVGRFELPASSSRTKRAAKLRYTPPPAPDRGARRTFASLAETRTARVGGAPAAGRGAGQWGRISRKAAGSGWEGSLQDGTRTWPEP